MVKVPLENPMFVTAFQLFAPILNDNLAASTSRVRQFDQKLVAFEEYLKNTYSAIIDRTIVHSPRYVVFQSDELYTMFVLRYG